MAETLSTPSSPVTDREVTLMVCIKERVSYNSPSCGQRGSQTLATALDEAIAQRHWPIQVKRILCFGQCAQGPNVRIAPGGEIFRHVTLDDLPRILKAVEVFAGLST
ncbi:MAG: (2Fe-2S) ferredoxin domain-containing protein [Magnetococcales bacterium]|nr:(2Fe-2S) ferredoxin domain-containing protein [Magnetococcales bacterium]